MGKHAQSIDQSILRRIRARGRGAVFTPVEFLDLGSRGAVDKALARNARAGTIRKLARGLYDFPYVHATLGPLFPASDVVARALAARDAARIQPTGAYAANLLGLTTQVPVKVVYQTDGGSRSVTLGRLQILLRKTTPRQLATADRISGTVIQALRWLGRRNIDDSTAARLRRRLSADDKRQLLADLRYAPDWMRESLRSIAKPFDRRNDQGYSRAMGTTRALPEDVRARAATILEIARRHGMELPRVFGSVAEGSARSDSDLDLLVRLGPDRGYADLLAFCDELELRLGRKVDVLTEDSLHPVLHREILAEAIAL